MHFSPLLSVSADDGGHLCFDVGIPDVRRSVQLNECKTLVATHANVG